jgi:hypothetical protein
LWWVLLAFVGGIATAMFAEELILRAQGNRIEFTAPRTHFVSGRLLARVRNAEQVALDFQATLAAGSPSNIVRTNTARFVISYDLWEERFAVNQVSPARKSSSHKTSSEAETWCLQQLSMTDLNGILPTQPLWAHVEIRAQAERDSKLFGISDDGIALTGLIELFSKPAKVNQQRWPLDAGPMTLEQMRR